MTTSATESVGQAKRSAPAPRFGISPGSLQALVLVAFLIVLVVAFACLDNRFISPNNIITIFGIAAVVGIVSLGQTLVILCGGFDLSVSGVVPLAGVVFALLSSTGMGWGPALIGTLVAGAIVGLVNGVAVAYLKINPLIATLGVLSITGGLALTLADGQQVPFAHPEAGLLAMQGVGRINNQVWIYLGLAVVLAIVLRFTTFGRRLYAVGGNPEAARLAGVRTQRVILVTYMLCAACAGLAGVIQASQLLTGSGTAGTDSNLQSIAAVILGGAALSGGRGGVAGTFLGVLILGVLSNGLSLLHVPSFYQTMITGVVLLLAVLVSNMDPRTWAVFRRAGGSPIGQASASPSTK